MWGGSSPGGRGAPDELAVALRGGLGRWCVTVLMNVCQSLWKKAAAKSPKCKGNCVS